MVKMAEAFKDQRVGRIGHWGWSKDLNGLWTGSLQWS